MIHHSYVILLCGLILLSGFMEPAVSQSEDILIRANWRSGEMARFEFQENIQVWDEGILSDESTYSSFFLVEVAGIRPQEGYILLWRTMQSDAPLFDDPLLDEYVYGLLTDGIVIHTDAFGAYSHSSNIEQLWRNFRDAVDILDQRNHWEDWQEIRKNIQYYMDEREAFEGLLVRDIRYLLGLNGVNIVPDETYKYDTWQENPWGEPVVSKGTLNVEKFDADSNTIEINNDVDQHSDDIPGLSLSEYQRYTIQLDSGWPEKALFRDEAQFEGYSRSRLVQINKFEY